MTTSLAAWWAAGSRVRLRIYGAERQVFVTQSDTNSELPWLTLLHGFPASSYDWHLLWPTLAARYRLLAFDFLGYGASDKPRALRYSTALHADTTCAIWAELGITRTQLVGHDIGTAVTQELLARSAEARLDCQLEAVLLMNGAVLIERYRPNLRQRLLLSRWLGPLIASATNRRRFVHALAAAFGAQTPADAAWLEGFWLAMSEGAGHTQLHRLLHHIPERVQERARWEGALHHTRVPLHFMWGRADPYVGFVADDIRRHLPAAPLETLDVGHFPQLEAPGDVARAILRMRSV